MCAETDFKLVVELLQKLGFLINWDKSVANAINAEYFGLLITSCGLSFTIPEAKVSSVKSMCEVALAANLISLREIAQHHGKIYIGDPGNLLCPCTFLTNARFYNYQT